jgi:hypothetical protein
MLSPPNDSPGTGAATVEIDTAARTLTIRINLAGLTGRFRKGQQILPWQPRSFRVCSFPNTADF